MVRRRCKHIMRMLENTWKKLGVRRSKNYYPQTPTCSPPIGNDFDVLVHVSWFHWLWNFFPKLHWLCIFALTNALFFIGKEKKGKNVLEVLITFYLVFYLHYLILYIFWCLDHEGFGCYIFMVTCMKIFNCTFIFLKLLFW